MSFKKKIKNVIPRCLIRFYHLAWAFVGACFYRFPSRSIKVIGVTGTSGKSTVVELIRQVLDEGGYKVASFSSIGIQLGDQRLKNELKMTMPGRGRLQRFLRRARNKNCRYVVVEVTSEGIKQYRHRFINFDTVVFTNLSPEHIERHGGFENYKKAKGRLFNSLRSSCKEETTIVANLDDKYCSYFLNFEADRKIGFGIENDSVSVEDKFIAQQVDLTVKGSSFKVKGVDFNLHLLGRFNTYNALTAMAVGALEEIDLESIAETLSQVEQMPGRMEIVIEEPFTVIVDYAHTPEALKQVYQTVQPFLSDDSKMIGVLGACGGGRDKWKRPVLGKIASSYCDEIILTNEDPYDEDPREIVDQVGKRIPESFSSARVIMDREEAIKQALQDAHEGDVVVISGKGSENLMCIAGGKKISWDDRKVVREKFSQLDI